MTEILNDSPNEGEVQVAEEPLPTVETPTPGITTAEPTGIKLLPLDPAFVTIERMTGWIFTGCVLLVGLVAVAVIAFTAGPLSLISAGCLLTYCILGTLLAWATHSLPQKAYDHAGWCLTPSGLEIRRGIWWRSQISVPLARVQHTDVHQGPLMRKFDLAKLIVHTAGTENSTVELSGLNFTTAQRLRDALVESRGDLDGV